MPRVDMNGVSWNTCFLGQWPHRGFTGRRKDSAWVLVLQILRNDMPGSVIIHVGRCPRRTCNQDIMFDRSGKDAKQGIVDMFTLQFI